MSEIDDYLENVEESCGEDSQFIVTFKHDKRAEAKTKILQRAEIHNAVHQTVYELEFQNNPFRLYGTGKVIFRNLKDQNELRILLADLLL